MNRRNLIAGIAALPLLALPTGASAEPAPSIEEVWEAYAEQITQKVDKEFMDLWERTPYMSFVGRGSRYSITAIAFVDESWPEHLVYNHASYVKGPFYRLDIAYQYRGYGPEGSGFMSIRRSDEIFLHAWL